MPAGETEFARDTTFTYRASDLTEWCQEKTGGAYPAEQVVSISLDELRRRGYATQMIPGITSFCAVAATLGTSLTDRDSPLHIYPDETENLDMALELSGTKVLMKSGKAIGETAAALSCRGLAKEASMVADCGLPSQRIFSEMTDLPENVGVSSTVIVPEGHRAARKK